MGDGWRLTLDADNTQASAALAVDALWNAYSLGDLLPPWRTHTQVALATRGEASAVCLLLRHPAVHALIPAGDPEGLAAILAAVDLPERTSVLLQAVHRATIERYYTFAAEPEPMLRMALDAAAFQPPAGWDALAERLGPADLPLLAELYATYAASAFHADQLAIGPCYGIRERGELLAAAGTHAYAPAQGIAAIGNVVTRAEDRGRGYASAVTSAVVAELVAYGCRTVALNVAQANTTAQHVYARLGFRVHCPYLEGQAVRRSAIR